MEIKHQTTETATDVQGHEYIAESHQTGEVFDSQSDAFVSNSTVQESAFDTFAPESVTYDAGFNPSEIYSAAAETDVSENELNAEETNKSLNRKRTPTPRPTHRRKPIMPSEMPITARAATITPDKPMPKNIKWIGRFTKKNSLIITPTTLLRMRRTAMWTTPKCTPPITKRGRLSRRFGRTRHRNGGLRCVVGR